MFTNAPIAPRASVSVDQLNDATIRVGLSPLSSLGMLTFDSVQEESRLGVPPQIRRAIRSHLRARDLETLSIFAHRAETPPSLIGERIATPVGLARILCGDPEPGENDLDEELEAIAETDPQQFLDSVRECAAESSSGAWTALLSHPSGWLRDYLTALMRAWRAVEPLWRQSVGLLDREVERVDAAVARGASADLLAALHRRTTIAERRWRLPTDTQPVSYRLAGVFVAAPMITDPTATAIFTDGAGTLPILFYPAGAAWHAFDGALSPPASLEALVGRQRAKILRSLETPRRPGQIAELLYTVPGGATHHLRQLEAAGLIARERQGQHVTVELTARGTALIALYES